MEKFCINNLYTLGVEGGGPYSPWQDLNG